MRVLAVQLSLLLLIGLAAASGPRVQIKNGTLEGLLMQTRLGREFVGFRGIPYALPPVDELRFEPPKPAASWDGVRLARDDGNICSQINGQSAQLEMIGMEDCLYLNVYTPALPTEDGRTSKGGYPVMIWIHGGGWQTGTGNSPQSGPKFLMDHDVVLVTINYRLGPFGFLSTEDMVCPGNQGMKDQAQSIRWVQENIAAFGGDPNRVTIFGASAGAGSVNYHMISPLSKGLFHRAISQSGNVCCPWSLTRPGQAKTKARRMAEHLKCPTNDSAALVNCLRGKNPVEVTKLNLLFQVFDCDPLIPFRPVIEPEHPGAFLTEDPAIAMIEGRVADIPWLTGINSEEGSLRVPDLYGPAYGASARKLDENFEELAPISLLYMETCPMDLWPEIGRKIRKFYVGDRPIDNSTRFDVINMYSDAFFTHGVDSSIRHFLRRQSSPVYYYYFSFKGSTSFSAILGDPTRDYGVCHGDELHYLFPIGEHRSLRVQLSKEDQRMIDTLTTLWTNFAASGNPTPEKTKVVPRKWKPVRTEALEYFHISNDKLEMGQNLLKERVSFWDSLPIRAHLQDLTSRGKLEDEL